MAGRAHGSASVPEPSVRYGGQGQLRRHRQLLRHSPIHFDLENGQVTPTPHHEMPFDLAIARFEMTRQRSAIDKLPDDRGHAFRRHCQQLVNCKIFVNPEAHPTPTPPNHSPESPKSPKFRT